jgi:hypothetical protein
MTSPRVRPRASRWVAESRSSANERNPSIVSDGVQPLWAAYLTPPRCRRHRSARVRRMHLRVAVRHDVGDLGPDEMVVDRDEVPARLQGSEVELDDLDAVG